MYSKFITKASAAVMAAAMALNGAVVSTANVIAADAAKYEFEDAELTGTIEAVDETGASGGKIAYMKEDGTISLDVEVASAGMYTITIYAGGVGGAKQQSISINGVSDTLAVPESESFEPIAISAKLNEGKNTIVITKSWGWTKFDYLTVETASLPEIKATQTTPCDPDATAETVSLMNYFASVYGEHIISGQQEIYQYGPHGLEQEFEYLKEKTGHYPAIRGFDYGNRCCELFGANDDGSTDRIIDWVKNKGGIATASFHLNLPKDFKNYTGGTLPFEQTTYAAKIDDKPATDFVTANAYKEGTKEYEYYRAALERLATEFNKLQDEGIPVLWRPLHEAEGGGGETGSWFWWGKEGSAVYKELWKYTYKTLTEDFGCHNLIWEWNSYNFDTSADWYPGDEYVDIIGYDKYNCTVYLAENNWQPSLVHNDSAISSTFYSIMQKYNNAKMVAMAENDSFSTVENLTTEKAGWLYFCTWYDGGSDNINFLTNPIFNTEEDTIAMYQSDYCITLDELPEDLYTNGEVLPHDPVETTTTTTNDSTGQETTTTATTDEEYKFKIEKKSVTLPEGNRTGYVVNITIEGEAGASVGGGIGYGTTADDWKNIEWNGTVGKDGTLTKQVFIDEIPETFTSAEVQVWWSNVYDAATDSATDVPYTLVSAEVERMGTGVPSVIAGDANLDGSVSISDAVCILQYLSNSDKFPLEGQALKNADVDGAAGVTGKDAAAIQLVDAGVITAEELPLNPADYIPEI